MYWAIFIVVVVLLVLIGAGVAGFFVYRRVSAANLANATKPVLFYSSTAPEPAAAEIYSSDGIPNMILVNSKVSILTHGAAWTRTRELIEVLRRHFLIPVDISRNPGADPKQIFLMHPKKFASQLDKLVTDSGVDFPEAEKEFFRNITLAVMIERSIVQSAAQYADAVKHLFGPISAICPEIESLLGQISKTPAQQPKNAEFMNAALRSADRRTRFIAVLAVTMLVFTRDNAPVPVKVAELIRNINLEAILSCSQVDPLAFLTFERAIAVRQPYGRPSPAPAEIAQDAVKRGYSHAISSAVLAPLQFPLPDRPLPTACLVDLFVASRVAPFIAPIVDGVLSTACKSTVNNPVFIATMSRLCDLCGDELGLNQTVSAVKPVGDAALQQLSDNEIKAVNDAEEAVKSASADVSSLAPVPAAASLAVVEEQEKV